MGARSIAAEGRTSSCYFRTTADGDRRKALVQIDERCNLRCVHCFVSATEQGQTMVYHDITTKVIPRLAACRVDRVTLTGGEPTIHPRFLGVVRAFRDAGMGVGICTNATTLTDNGIAALAQIGGVHCNVSLDGFRPESHGKFRAIARVSTPPSPPSRSSRQRGCCRACSAPPTPWRRTMSTGSCVRSPSSTAPSTC